jgi:hypothetical protein
MSRTWNSITGTLQQCGILKKWTSFVEKSKVFSYRQNGSQDNRTAIALCLAEHNIESQNVNRWRFCDKRLKEKFPEKLEHVFPVDIQNDSSFSVVFNKEIGRSK